MYSLLKYYIHVIITGGLKKRLLYFIFSIFVFITNLILIKCSWCAEARFYAYQLHFIDFKYCLNTEEDVLLVKQQILK